MICAWTVLVDIKGDAVGNKHQSVLLSSINISVNAIYLLVKCYCD